MKKSLLILIIIDALIAVLLLFVWLKYINPQKVKDNQESSYLSQNDSRRTMGEKVYTQEIPSDTGAKYEEITYTPEEIETGKLIDLLPIKTDEFEMQMDFANDKVIVTVGPPYEINKDVFFSWLKEKGYGDINKEYFILKNR